MKTKTKATITIAACLLLTCLLMHSPVTAQHAGKVGSQPGQAQVGSQPAMMLETSSVQRLSNGNVLIDEKGTVQSTQTDENGSTKTVTISRPEIDLSKSVEAGYEAYVEGFIQWMKANPDYANFITAEQLALVNGENCPYSSR